MKKRQKIILDVVIGIFIVGASIVLLNINAPDNLRSAIEPLQDVTEGVSISTTPVNFLSTDIIQASQVPSETQVSQLNGTINDLSGSIDTLTKEIAALDPKNTNYSTTKSAKEAERQRLFAEKKIYEGIVQNYTTYKSSTSSCASTYSEGQEMQKALCEKQASLSYMQDTSKVITSNNGPLLTDTSVRSTQQGLVSSIHESYLRTEETLKNSLVINELSNINSELSPEAFEALINEKKLTLEQTTQLREKAERDIRELKGIDAVKYADEIKRLETQAAELKKQEEVKAEAIQLCSTAKLTGCVQVKSALESTAAKETLLTPEIETAARNYDYVKNLSENAGDSTVAAKMTDYEKAQVQAYTAGQNYFATTTELENLQKEASRLKELKALKDKGTITDTQQTELTDLENKTYDGQTLQQKISTLSKQQDDQKADLSSDCPIDKIDAYNTCLNNLAKLGIIEQVEGDCTKISEKLPNADVDKLKNTCQFIQTTNQTNEVKKVTDQIKKSAAFMQAANDITFQNLEVQDLPGPSGDIGDLLNKFIRFFAYTAGSLGVLMWVVSSFMVIWGSEASVTAYKTKVRNIAIGLLLIFGAYIIISGIFAIFYSL